MHIFILVAVSQLFYLLDSPQSILFYFAIADNRLEFLGALSEEIALTDLLCYMFLFHLNNNNRVSQFINK